MTISKLINHFATIPSEIIFAEYNRENNNIETYKIALKITNEENKKIYKLFFKVMGKTHKLTFDENNEENETAYDFIINVMGKWKVYDWRVIKISSNLSLLNYINKPAKRWSKKNSNIDKL